MAVESSSSPGKSELARDLPGRGKALTDYQLSQVADIHSTSSMDPLRLLSRSTGLRKGRHDADSITSSNGPKAQSKPLPSTGGKRKRGQDATSSANDHAGDLDFFHAGSRVGTIDPADADQETNDVLRREEKVQIPVPSISAMSDQEASTILAQHKLKVTLLNPSSPQAKRKRKGRNGDEGKVERLALYPQPLASFEELRNRFELSRNLAKNLAEQGYTIPTEVQLAALPVLLDATQRYLPGHKELPRVDQEANVQVDLLTVAPTGSGKTLAFMIPLLHRIQSRRRREEQSTRHISAIVLAPTKELAGQITNEGRKLAKGTGVRVTQVRKGMRLARFATSPLEAEADIIDEEDAAVGEQTVAKADVLISTPGALHSILNDSPSARGALDGVQQLVLDEADVLLDPLFREQTLGIWHRLSNPTMSVSLWSATMGSNIEELALSTVKDWRDSLLQTASGAKHEAPFIRLVVGLKDSAVPNVHHKLIYAATEQGKLMGLRQLLHPASSQSSSAPLLPPFLIFTQTIERAVALHSELLYDIPSEAGGINRIAVLHADLSDTARDSVMTRFRKGEIWVLITTDLLSRGVDFRGVNGVVNYDIPTSSAAYVHRVGRTGRAGREGGVAVTLYSKEDIPYLKHVANVIAMAQRQDGAKKDDGLQQWLLDTLPKLSKNEKQKLKRRGIESRASRGNDEDSKAARRSRISSKAGFVRQAENNRRGAVIGSQRRALAEAAGDDGDDTDFAGFD
ncbi:RNA-dependent ATPase rok1 [Teratosphaeriaceae sp. CCFEE 6253]|nr:RNA-dependent ATPase rok1 [Teratosphaeriaceae sp. CCFEE 6253]